MDVFRFDFVCALEPKVEVNLTPVLFGGVHTCDKLFLGEEEVGFPILHAKLVTNNVLVPQVVHVLRQLVILAIGHHFLTPGSQHVVLSIDHRQFAHQADPRVACKVVQVRHLRTSKRPDRTVKFTILGQLLIANFENLINRSSFKPSLVFITAHSGRELELRRNIKVILRDVFVHVDHHVGAGGRLPSLIPFLLQQLQVHPHIDEHDQSLLNSLVEEVVVDPGMELF